MSTKKRESESDYKVLREYWRLHGGTSGLLKSCYFYAAILLVIIGHAHWMNTAWWSMPLEILPSMLGFSLAGFAIFLAFGNDGFREFLVRARIKDSSAYVSLTATFMHFVLLQVFALLLALAAKLLASIYISPPEALAIYLVILQKFFWLVGFFLFSYALTTSLASVIAIFRIVRLFERYTAVTGGSRGGAAGEQNPPRH